MLTAIMKESGRTVNSMAKAKSSTQMALSTLAIISMVDSTAKGGWKDLMVATTQANG